LKKVTIALKLTTIKEKAVHARLQSMTDSKGNDITDKFVNYCDDKQLIPKTQAEFDQAEILFVKENSSWLP
jgi:hypothetical protein